MKITNIAVKTEKVILVNHFLVGNYKLKPDYKKQINKINDNDYEVRLFIVISNTKENPFPFDLEIVLSGVFKIEQIDDEKSLEDFLNMSAVQTLFPYMRSIISSLTASSLIHPLVLPIVDVRIFKNI